MTCRRHQRGRSRYEAAACFGKMVPASRGGTGIGRDRALMGMRARQQYRSDRTLRGTLAFGGDRLAPLELSVKTVRVDSHTHNALVERPKVVDTGRRRRWSEEEKLRIVAESLSGPRLVSATARRYGHFDVAVVHLAPRLSAEHISAF
jgi:hypothetical protein